MGNPNRHYQFYVVWKADNRCVLFPLMREGNHDLCGGVAELHGFYGR